MDEGYFRQPADTGRGIRGLFSGGTLCYEALNMLKTLGQQVCLEEDLDEAAGADSHGRPVEAILTDLGDDRYTVGRPHPMIDFRTRCERIVEEASRPEVGVLLLDVILGYGAHPDPAAELVPALNEARARPAVPLKRPGTGNWRSSFPCAARQTTRKDWRNNTKRSPRRAPW